MSALCVSNICFQDIFRLYMVGCCPGKLVIPPKICSFYLRIFRSLDLWEVLSKIQNFNHWGIINEDKNGIGILASITQSQAHSLTAPAFRPMRLCFSQITQFSYLNALYTHLILILILSTYQAQFSLTCLSLDKAFSFGYEKKEVRLPIITASRYELINDFLHVYDIPDHFHLKYCCDANLFSKIAISPENMFCWNHLK